MAQLIVGHGHPDGPAAFDRPDTETHVRLAAGLPGFATGGARPLVQQD